MEGAGLSAIKEGMELMADVEGGREGMFVSRYELLEVSIAEEAKFVADWESDCFIPG